MEVRKKKPGSVRLTDEQYQEMYQLGISSESAFVKYKLDQAQEKLEVLKASKEEPAIKTLPVAQGKIAQNTMVEDKLTIQRLALENQSLKNKLEEISENNQQTLSGVNHKVHAMLQEELMKRDFEALKTTKSKQEEQIEKLEEELKKSRKETETKQEEIEALVKKLGLVELGKALLPGAISGLAKQYPQQMKGIATTLGSLGLKEANVNTDQDQDYLLEVLNHLSEIFTEEQFVQVVQLMMKLGEQMEEDQQLMQKISYYIDQLKEKRNNQE